MNSGECKFLFDNLSLTNRMNFVINKDSCAECILKQIDNYTKDAFKAESLQVHFLMSKEGESLSKVLIDVLKNIYDFKMGYEKKYPIVSIYYFCKNIDENIIAEINKYDKYRPGINLYLALDEDDILADSVNDSRLVCKNSYSLFNTAKELGINTNFLLYLNKDVNRFEDMIEMRRLLYTWDTSIEMNKPIIQIAPKLIPNMGDELLQRVIDIEEDNNIYDIPCGLMTIIRGFKESRGMPSEYIPLNACGAGKSKVCYQADKDTICYQSNLNNVSNQLFDLCKGCEYVGNCNGCAHMINVSNGSCALKRVYSLIEN